MMSSSNRGFEDTPLTPPFQCKPRETAPLDVNSARVRKEKRERALLATPPQPVVPVPVIEEFHPGVILVSLELRVS